MVIIMENINLIPEDQLGDGSGIRLAVCDTEHDLWLAKNAGCASVAVSYGAFPKSELLKWKVPVVDDVPQLATALGVDELLNH